MPAAPLTPEEFAALMARLGPFEARPRVAVAVSGGADSMALALLARDWAADAVFLTVDHGLRPDSAAEAAGVAERLGGTVLRWAGDKPAADLQNAARQARYRLLGEFCRAHGILHLLLAHHRDDQAETLLLRLGRGSGVDGLAAMAAVQPTDWGRLLRPLLEVPRERLRATVAARGGGWVEDPANANPRFARARLRRLLPQLAAEGLAPDRLAATARRLGRARQALEQATAEAAARAVEVHPAGFALVRPGIFAAVPDEVGLRLLARLLGVVGGEAHPPRLDRLERLHGEIVGLPVARTLAGCRIAPWRGRVVVSREPAKAAGPLRLGPGEEAVWDGRFRIRALENVTVRCLDPADWRRIRRERPVLPAAVAAVLPALYGEDDIFAVPHLGYNLGLAGQTVQSIVLAPPRPLTVAGHCLV